MEPLSGLAQAGQLVAQGQQGAEGESPGLGQVERQGASQVTVSEDPLAVVRGRGRPVKGREPIQGEAHLADGQEQGLAGAGRRRPGGGGAVTTVPTGGIIPRHTLA